MQGLALVRVSWTGPKRAVCAAAALGHIQRKLLPVLSPTAEAPLTHTASSHQTSYHIRSTKSKPNTTHLVCKFVMGAVCRAKLCKGTQFPAASRILPGARTLSTSIPLLTCTWASLARRVTTDLDHYDIGRSHVLLMYHTMQRDVQVFPLGECSSRIQRSSRRTWYRRP